MKINPTFYSFQTETVLTLASAKNNGYSDHFGTTFRDEVGLSLNFVKSLALWRSLK